MKATRLKRGLTFVTASLLVAAPAGLVAGMQAIDTFATEPDPTWWTLSGDAIWDESTRSIFLTDVVNDQAGSIFWPWKFQTHWFCASFDFWIGGGSGGEGFAFAWVKDADFLGEGGESLGLGGLDGYAIRFDTSSGGGNEPENYIAFSRIAPEGKEDLLINSDIPQMEDVLDNEGNPAPFRVGLWVQGGYLHVGLRNPTAATPIAEMNVLTIEMPDYTPFDSYFGFTAATSSADNIHAIDNVIISEMDMVPENAVYAGDPITLSANVSDAISYTWKQIAGEPIVPLDEPWPGACRFIAPDVTVGRILTFELTIVFATGGEQSDTVQVTILARNPPKVAPGNLRVMPLDLGAAGLGFRVEWEPVLDAEEYQIGLKLGPEILWMDTVWGTAYEVRRLSEGEEQTILVRGENRFCDPSSTDPADHGVPSEEVTAVAMPNLARPESLGGTHPPSQYVSVGDTDPGGINDGQTDDSTNSSGISPELTVYWGYTWDEALFFNHVVYFTGQMVDDGGWFTDLKVQYTEDGDTWIDVPIIEIFPEYDFTDSRKGERSLSRYDIVIPKVRGTGIRICGTPGGRAAFASIAEMEVYGDQSPHIGPPLPDGEVPEGGIGILDGTLLFLPHGAITAWHWDQVSGPTVTIEDPDDAVATFQAPWVDEYTPLVFRVTYSDEVEEETQEFTVRVRNLETTAVAGRHQRVVEESEVTLDGSGSLTTTGNLTYLWTQTAGTDVGVTGSTTATLTFDAPVLWDFMHEVTFRLDVDDGAGGVSSDEVTVTVYNFAGLISPLGPGYFKELLHLGNTNIDRITAPLNINNDALEKWGGECCVNPRPGEPYDFTDTALETTVNPMVWTPEHTNNGWFMWDGRPSEALDNFQQIYHLYIISPENRNVIWHFRHDNGLRIWNNGVLVVVRDRGDYGQEQHQIGLVSAGWALSKGVNSISLKFEEGGWANYLAVCVTDLDGNEFSDLSYSLGLPFRLADVYAVRKLPAMYEAGRPIKVELSMRVKPDATPGSVLIREKIPAGLTAADVNAPGAVVADGNITWHLVGEHVRTLALSYEVTPGGTTRSLHFEGRSRSIIPRRTSTETRWRCASLPFRRRRSMS